MAPITVDGIEGLKEIVGQQIGPSDWREVTQDMINTFADVSGDHQWIHVDIERAKNESPFGGPIAHGNLTLSIIDGFREQLTEAKGFKLGVNYGWNKVRFPAPVPAGSRVRAYSEVLSVDDVGGGWFQAVTKFTVEIEGGEKPVCVAESVARFLP
jgi:acyl dehydratase